MTGLESEVDRYSVNAWDLMGIRKGDGKTLDAADSGRTFTSRIASWSAVHRWFILLVSVVVIVLAFLSISLIGADTRDDDTGMGESGRGTDLLRERFNTAAARPQGVDRTRHEGVIFSSTSLVANDPLFKDAVESEILRIRDVP